MIFCVIICRNTCLARALNAVLQRFCLSLQSIISLLPNNIVEVFLLTNLRKSVAYFFNSTFLTFTVINCTSLTQMVAPEGPVRVSSCANHFGAQCEFFCTTGYRLNGSSTVTCVAPGNQHPGVWDNTIPTCEGKQEKREKRRATRLKHIVKSLKRHVVNI